MPSNVNAMAALAAIDKGTDKSKVLGVRVGERAVEPVGLYIPRAGTYIRGHAQVHARYLNKTQR